MLRSRLTAARAIFLTLGAVAALGLATLGSADQVYHSERLDLAPLAAQEGTGQVVNIHANGPVIGALERYHLRGAEEGAYEVWIQVCGEGSFTDFVQTAVLETDAQGKGHAQGFFSAADLEPLSGAVVNIRWVLRLEGIDEYATECTTVTID